MRRFATVKAIWLSVLLALCAGSYAFAASNPSTPRRSWTIMIFMNGKNNLERDALNNFHAMASVGSTDEVAIVAELGRPKNPSSSDGGWSGVYRFLVGKDTQPRPKNAVEKVPAGKSSDMGRVDTLTDFVGWSKAKYPADHYMLIVWNHGQGYRLQMSAVLSRALGGTSAARLNNAPNAVSLGGFRAVSSDSDTGSILYNSEVQQAIATHFKNGEKLDVLGFDACLMAMLETAYAFETSTRLMVASEDLEPGDGWQYADWLDKIVANPAMSGEEIGKAVVKSYADHYGDSYFTTLSLLDLSHARDAAAALTTFSDAVRKGGKSELEAMQKARKELSSYGDWDTPPSHLSVDLTTLLERFAASSSSEPLRQLAARAVESTQLMVLANYASARAQGEPGEDLYGSKGVAIYYPRSSRDYKQDPFRQGYQKDNRDRPITFVRDERWAELLHVLLGI
ncbi:hypothetical protein FHX08_005347 [Rhizobium sp. BK529]|uniref:clostripain-related cysteine peptidase n=1 Tax=Rhizobium sp. BK529 TaxID=2586983 RepID=UPI0016119BCE|nr:clostripain-related cysteine peptidase [Rhizobium sp. BK529]MBB3594937.1 hypothetical protein [Rhizobium sp. BK529]